MGRPEVAHCPQWDGLVYWGPGSGRARCVRAALGHQEAVADCCLVLCFPPGSECATSCLDHNSESIILPVNVTVQDIPHWLNPTRVEVSGWGFPPGLRGAVASVDTCRAPGLS